MTKTSASVLKTAAIEWRDNIPFCSEFDDVYYRSEQPFSENGLKETEYLFLQQNQLEQRWKNLSATQHCDNAVFVIGETGFGTGLNFLSACDLWLKTATKNCRLQFISTEIRPITAADLKAIHKNWSVFSDLSEQLLDQYPVLTPGVHLISMAQGRIQLLLLLGDTNQMLKSIAQSPQPFWASYQRKSVDAWFLDGFAPTKNPDMWTDDIFETVASLSFKETTLATFTCASHVRKGLINAGFDVAKVEGFSNKRESLKGSFNGQLQPEKVTTTHWYIDQLTSENKQRDVLIVGAGIAGCTTAEALSKRGFNVRVIDRHTSSANEGSGNLQAVVYPKLSRQHDALPRINLTAMTLASRYYKTYWDRGLGAQCGVMLLPDSDQSKLNLQQIAERYAAHTELVTQVDSQKIRAISGLSLDAQQGLFFPRLGWIPPQTFCQTLLDENNIPLLTADIDHIERDSHSAKWVLKDHKHTTIASAQIVVIATAYECANLEQTNFLSVNQLRGQVTHIPSQSASNELKTVICGKGYIAPVADGVQSCGATYNKGLLSKELRAEDHNANITMLNQTDQGLAKSINIGALGELDGRANFRCTTNDYLPIVGAVPNAQNFKQQYGLLRHDATSIIDCLGSYQPDLYIHCGLGSRGLSYAPLTAEILASDISGEIPPLERDLRLAMHPARFLMRDLKRRKI
jgi:tRNA 5-methylaminomethyl-2-thiouridine biosynthesis bifunctional protein